MIQNLNKSSLIKRYPILEECEGDIVKAINGLIKCYEDGGKLITFGNGGSACDAEHICGELQKGFLSKRALSQKECEKFSNIDPDLPSKLQGGLPAISLSTQFATQSAFSNDVDPEYVLAQQVFVLSQTNDVAWGISTSGNSPNVVHALKIARAKDLFSIALTGDQSSLCEKYATVTIKAPAKIVHEIQELHLPIYHSVCMELEYYFF